MNSAPTTASIVGLLLGGAPVGNCQNVPGLLLKLLMDLKTMTRWFCFLFVRHKWRYLSDFTSRQCQSCKCRQRAWLKDRGYVWLPEGKLP
jgi:hypothetical protein